MYTKLLSNQEIKFEISKWQKLQSIYAATEIFFFWQKMINKQIIVIQYICLSWAFNKKKTILPCHFTRLIRVGQTLYIKE